MTVERAAVGEPYTYRGHTVTATLASPDLLGQIDGEEMPHFYMSLAALRKNAEKMIDAKFKALEEKKHERRRNGR